MSDPNPIEPTVAALPASPAPTPTAPAYAHPPRRASSYLWRLAILIPAFALAVYGYRAYSNVPAGGSIHSVKLTTKGDIAGQTRDAYDTVDPATADLYLIVRPRTGESITTQPFKDTVIGSGLTWNLTSPLEVTNVGLIEVWDSNAVMKDKQLDRIEFGGAWVAKGQTFQIELLGTRPSPPPWALPLAAAGATLAGVVLLRFVWDQAI